MHRRLVSVYGRLSDVNRRLAVALGIAGVVLVASLTPVQSGGTAAGLLGGGVDKLLHLVGYAVLTYVAASAVEARSLRGLAVVVLGATVFGAGVEFLQPFVGRTASALDALANLGGALAGALLWSLSRSR